MFYRCEKKPKMASGTFNAITSGTTKVTLGFKSKYLYVSFAPTSFNTLPQSINIYNADYSESKVIRATVESYIAEETLPHSGGNRIASIDVDGFTVSQASNNRTFCRYFAIG